MLNRVMHPGRPLLAVPHILADESSAYYHGYVLAEMSVHQTRGYFKAKYGTIADNPEVGKQLTEVRKRVGNGIHRLAGSLIPDGHATSTTLPYIIG